MREVLLLVSYQYGRDVTAGTRERGWNGEMWTGGTPFGGAALDGFHARARKNVELLWLRLQPSNFLPAGLYFEVFYSKLLVSRDSRPKLCPVHFF